MAALVLPNSGRSIPQSQRTSVTSFQTAPLAPSVDGYASSSRDSFQSQNTVSAVGGVRRSQDMTTSPKGKERERERDLPNLPAPPSIDKLAHGSLPRVPTPTRIDTSGAGTAARQDTQGYPPSPPPSVSPKDERTFEDVRSHPAFVAARRLYDETAESEPHYVETPATLEWEEQQRILAFEKIPHPQPDPILEVPEPKATLSILPIFSNSAKRGSEDATPAPAKQVTLAAGVGVDYLHPPPLVRPTRRNTTGSSSAVSRPSRTLVASHAHMSVQMSSPFPSTGELDNDIQNQAEQIRAERRAKAQADAEAEAAMTAPPRGGTGHMGEGALVGKIIGEDHVNYVLMYNMLTGIRVAVSRCQAKIKRPLTIDDFTASHKYSFDIIGNELTPSAKYDFKFKDYAPNVFRELRESTFGLDPSDYLVSLTAKYILSELGSPGKSGSFFYFSRDYRFIIKTLHAAEHKFLRRVLSQYHAHMKDNPHSLLSRFYGLHRVKLPRGRKIHFVIMNNLFPPHRDIHETYDLKGSTVGRELPEEKVATDPRAVMKDLNFIHRNRSLDLGPEKRALLTEQIRRDTELLKAIHVMDYSLLIGIHNMQRGNRDNLRRNTLKVFSPSVPPRRQTTSQSKSRAEASAIRRAMRASDPKAIALDLPDEDPEDKKQFLFYQDEGGLRSTDEANEPTEVIYYLGIIDICTPWSFFKQVEGIWKGMKNDRHKISPVPPKEYGERFFAFMQAIMRGGAGGEAFLEKPKEVIREEIREKQE